MWFLPSSPLCLSEVSGLSVIQSGVLCETKGKHKYLRPCFIWILSALVCLGLGAQSLVLSPGDSSGCSDEVSSVV